MPTVPKAMAAAMSGGVEPGLLSNEPPSQRPDASSILMAGSVMANMGRLGRGAGASLTAPRKQKGSGRSQLK